jgi:hypothetical protein
VAADVLNARVKSWRVSHLLLLMALKIYIIHA